MLTRPSPRRGLRRLEEPLHGGAERSLRPRLPRADAGDADLPLGRGPRGCQSGPRTQPRTQPQPRPGLRAPAPLTPENKRIAPAPAPRCAMAGACRGRAAGGARGRAGTLHRHQGLPRAGSSSPPGAPMGWVTQKPRSARCLTSQSRGAAAWTPESEGGVAGTPGSPTGLRKMQVVGRRQVYSGQR